MANSRKPSSNDLQGAVAAALAPAVTPGAHLALGLSGGIDSVALLSILLELAPALRFSLRAVHVNHGISPNAARWAEFCAGICQDLRVPFQLETVDIAPYRTLGLEGAARRARYEALAQIEADFVVLAHHRDDQAETLLLQLLRGAGLRGLAGMPPLRTLPGTRAQLLRPFLDVPRAAIEAYAHAKGLAWVEDESNADTARQRNFLRHEVLPLLERQFPAARATIARAAAHVAEAGVLLDEMARTDFERTGGAAIEISFLRELGTAHAKNLLRYVCDARGIRAPGAALLDELLRQLLEARRDAAVGFTMSGWDFRRYRGKLYLEPHRAAVEAELREDWSGENALPLLGLGGVLSFRPEEGRGLSLPKLRSEPVTVRLRRGGERLRPDCRRPRRSLKNLFQEKRVPPWQRDRLPLLYCGENLVSVPEVGYECEFQAAPGEPGLIVVWELLDQRGF
ncbi:MAG: tRNA lysidine(34) synthetase TilS [Burkholderiales bacterium]